MKDDDDTAKDVFYDKLEVLYNRCPRSDIKILVGDFSTKVGREGIFGPIVGKTQSAREIKIDHIVIEGRHASSILDVRTIRSANMVSDHFLVAAKVRTHLCACNNSCKSV